MKRMFLALLLSLFPIMMNQTGAIGFGVERFQNRMLLDKKKDDTGGAGGKGGKADDDEEDEDEDEEEDDDQKPGASGKNKKGSKKPGASKDEEEDEEEDDQESDLSKLPEWAQKKLKKLGKENQSLRSKNKATDDRLGKIEKALKAFSGDDADDESPEDKLAKVTAQNQDLAARAAYQELALEHGIGKDQFKYFSFLMSEAISELGEDEEMDEEKLQEIVEQAKAKAPKASNTTSVDGKGKGGAGGKGPKKDDTVTAEQFKKMGIMQRSKLYRENPELYDALSKEVGF